MKKTEKFKEINKRTRVLLVCMLAVIILGIVAGFVGPVARWICMGLSLLIFAGLFIAITLYQLRTAGSFCRKMWNDITPDKGKEDGNEQKEEN